VLVEPLKDQTVITPESAKFTAGVRGGEPRSELRWFKAGKALSIDGVQYVGVFEGEEATLTIAQCELTDAGEYSLTATNKVASVTSKATLTVHGKAQTEYYVTRSSMLLGQVNNTVKKKYTSSVHAYIEQFASTM